MGIVRSAFLIPVTHLRPHWSRYRNEYEQAPPTSGHQLHYNANFVLRAACPASALVVWFDVHYSVLKVRLLENEPW